MASAPKRILTSGDLTADRRADYASMLAESDDFVAAAELLEQALELAPEWAAGWFMLGEYRQKAGRDEQAIAAFRKTIALEPNDIFGACLKLASLGAEPPPALPPSRYVEGLFDDYAERFEAALVEKLGYTVPGKLAALIARGGEIKFDLAVDLGCGTGLLGAEIHLNCSRLEGFDLSENMLAKARAKAIYQHLAQADLSLSPEDSGLFTGQGYHRADLVAGADVMMYLGDLDAAFANAAALLSSQALFVFSVEKSERAEGFELMQSLRYAHSEYHVRHMLAKHGLECTTVEETLIRMDAGQPITGLLFAAKRSELDIAA